MAQQVYGCKRGRLLSVAGDLAALPLLGAAATDCPRPPPPPQTPPLQATAVNSWTILERQVQRMYLACVCAARDIAEPSLCCPCYCTKKISERAIVIGRGAGPRLPAGAISGCRLNEKQTGEVACDFEQAGLPACSRTLVAPLRIKWLGIPAGDLH